MDRFLLSLLLVLVAATQSCAEEDRERAVLVERISRPEPSFPVRIDMDHADRQYRAGETMTIKVHSLRAGFLYLLNVTVEDEVRVLFPNRYQPDNRIRANVPLRIPAPGDSPSFRLRVGAPFGSEIIKAVVTERPLTDKELRRARETVGAEFDSDELRRVFVEPIQAMDWAEHQIRIHTLATAREEPEERRPKKNVCRNRCWRVCGSPHLTVKPLPRGSPSIGRDSAYTLWV